MTAPPRIEGRSQSLDDSIEPGIPFIVKTGILAFSDVETHCYKNGKDIEILHLSYDTENQEIRVNNMGPIRDSVGVYQCFAENEAGSAYSITRYLEAGEFIIICSIAQTMLMLFIPFQVLLILPATLLVM